MPNAMSSLAGACKLAAAAVPVFPPFEEALRLLYNAWRDAVLQGDSQAAATTLAGLLNKHPMVKKTNPEKEEHGQNVFKVTGFRVDVRAYNKWRKTPEGREYIKATGSKACHGFDDAVYHGCPMLRSALPRGCHYVEVFDAETGKRLKCFVFNGIPKFSGLQSTDEDEESDATASDFFLNEKSLPDAKMVFVTNKSNGENARIWGITVGAVRFWVTGSKNTITVTPVDAAHAGGGAAHDDDGDHAAAHDGDHDSKQQPWWTIRATVRQWYAGMTDAQRDLLFELFDEYGTLMAEINRPWAEHLVPINTTVLELYAMLGRDGHCVAPSVAFDAFQRLGLSDKSAPVRHVSFHVVALTGDAASDFAALVQAERSKADAEGSVLYLVDAAGDLFGLAKVKTTWYVVWRRIRELLRTHLFGPLTRGFVRGVPATATVAAAAKKQEKQKQQGLNEVLTVLRFKIKAGLINLDFLPQWDNECSSWQAKALAFVEALEARLDVLFATAFKAKDLLAATCKTEDTGVDLGALEFSSTLDKAVSEEDGGGVLREVFIAACSQLAAEFSGKYGTLVHQFETDLCTLDLPTPETREDTSASLETGGGASGEETGGGGGGGKK